MHSPPLEPHYQKNYHPTMFIIHHYQRTPPSYQNMPHQHAVLYQAFHEITIFICNNSNKWNKFCTNMTHTTR